MDEVRSPREEELVKKVTLQADERLRILTLNDPNRRNIIDDEMRGELLEAMIGVREDVEASALVVTGAGTAFCGGADLPAVFGDCQRSLGTIRDDLRKLYECFLVVQTLSIPTIAAVQGPAVGAGLNLALVCDLRIAGPHAKFAATFSQIGLHPGGGCTWFLVRTMGEQRALKLLLDGGTVLGQEAVEAGLAVSLDDDPLQAAIDLGRRYSRLDPQLSRDIKAAVHVAARDGFEATLQVESWAQAFSATKPELQRHVARFRK